MNTDTRTETKLLIARQLAQANGIKPDLIMIAGKVRNQYMTLAETLLATVERKARVSW